VEIAFDICLDVELRYQMGRGVLRVVGFLKV